jgi:hypothetical protein
MVTLKCICILLKRHLSKMQIFRTLQNDEKMMNLMACLACKSQVDRAAQCMMGRQAR